MPVPIVCPECGATYQSLKLAPGTAFACGDCSHTLHVPGAEKAAAGPGLPVVQPTARVPGAPVVQPTATPPVAQPAAGVTPPVVPPRVAPGGGPPPVVRPAGSAGAAPAVQPQRQPGPGPQKPGARPAQKGGPRRTTKRPHTRVVNTEELGVIPEKKSNTGIILASCFGVVALAVLVIVIVSVSGDSDMDKNNSYFSGYEDGARARMFKTLGLKTRNNPDMFEEFRAEYSGDAIMESFMEGLDDGRRGRSPRIGGTQLEAALWDSQNARDAFDRLRSRSGIDDANSLWGVAEFLGSVSEKWAASSAPSDIISMVSAERAALVKKVLEINPDHAQARENRGEFKYTDQLLQFVNAEYLQDGEKNRAKREHDRLKRVADKNGGWLAEKYKDSIARVESQFKDKAEKFTRFRDSPFYAKSMAMKERLAKDLKEILGKAQDRIADYEKAVDKWKLPDEVKKAMVENFKNSLKGLDEREYEAIISHPPYVLFVEKNEQWDTQLVAQQVLGPLTSLNDIFLDKYQEKWNLDKDQTEPIPVVYFRTAQAYQQYLFASQGIMNPGILAHFEPENGRLCIHDETDKTTIMHEGVHQLFWYHAKVKSDFKDQSFWFQEGVAEWFSGSRRWIEEGKWKYELGLLQRDRIKGARFVIGRGDIYALEDLIGFTYGDRNTGGVNVGLVYAQGWMLIYFLNYFDVDENGVVLVDTKDKPVVGRYRDVWERMLGYVLAGKDGKPHTGKAAFLDAAGVSSVDELTEMGDMFDRYQRWLSEKIKFNQYKDKRLLPWNEYRNRNGQKTGQESDDKLPEKRERKLLKDRKKKDDEKKDGEKKDGEQDG